MNGIIAKYLADATAPLLTDLTLVKEQVGVLPDAPTVDQRIRLVMGQDYPALAEGQPWAMSNRASYYAIQVLKTQVGALTDTLATTFGGLTLRLQIAEDALTTMQAQEHANELALAALDAYNQQTRQLAQLAQVGAVAAQATANQAAQAASAGEASTNALAKQQAADELRLLAVEVQAAATAAGLALVQARQTTDEAAIQAAQTAATAAQAKADGAESKATTAQTKATAAAQAATAAQATADNALTLAVGANSAAAAAQATATQAQSSTTLAISAAAAAQNAATAAQSATTALAGRFRTKRVPTVAMPLNGTVTQVITWDTPYADINYNPIPELEGAGLLGLVPTVLSRTATSVTVQIKNTLGLVLLANTGTLTITAMHD